MPGVNNQWVIIIIKFKHDLRATYKDVKPVYHTDPKIRTLANCNMFEKREKKPEKRVFAYLAGFALRIELYESMA